MEDNGELYILFKSNYNSDIDFICDMRRLDNEQFIELYKSYEKYCNCRFSVEDDSNRFMFHFQYTYNEIIGKKHAF